MPTEIAGVDNEDLACCSAFSCSQAALEYKLLWWITELQITIGELAVVYLDLGWSES
jgi:hypothetical protein